MKLRLDTHALIWAVMAPDRLGPSATQATTAEGTEVFASQLPIVAKHLAEVEFLPPLQGDPFDPPLVAQARVDGLTLVSVDRQVTKYDVGSLWN